MLQAQAGLAGEAGMDGSMGGAYALGGGLCAPHGPWAGAGSQEKEHLGLTDLASLIDNLRAHTPPHVHRGCVGGQGHRAE